MSKRPVPIPVSADLPSEFIPPIQDADTFKRLKTAEIRRREQALERRIAAHLKLQGEAEADSALLEQAGELNGLEGTIAEVLKLDQDAIDDEREQIAQEWPFMERNIATIREMYPTPQVFLIAIPTTVERDQINSRLISLGLSQVTQEQIRATLIEELFHQDWTEPGEDPIDDDTNLLRAEENANFLDGVWLRQEAHDNAIRLWQEQEMERVIDEAEGAPRRARAELPPRIITVREGSRMQLLVDRMMSQSQKLRDLAGQNLDFARRNAILLVRMHVVGVRGFEVSVPIERDRLTNALPEAAVLALREKVDDVSWNQLVGHIDELYKIDGGEEKNSVSPPEKLSPPNGSTEPSDNPARSGGSSTGSSSTQAPEGESGRTIDKS